MSNFKIITVPTEMSENNNIDQSSTVEEILNCDEHEIWDVGNLCQALNDEDLETTNYWLFLIDMGTKEHLNSH